MPNHNAAVPAPELVDKEIKVLELRRAGLTWQRIAEETGYANHTGDTLMQAGNQTHDATASR
jgi:DNA-binding NarL/FixJ family response regulator